MSYEYLLTGLPELHASEPAPISMEALEEMLEEQLTAADKEQMRLLRYRASTGVCRFIKDWQAFERTLNNTLTAEICRKHGLNLKQHVLGEMPDVEDKEVIAVSKIDDLYERERAIDALRFAWLEEATQSSFFGFDKVVAYYLELKMLHRWEVLTNEEGERVFRDIVADLKKGVKID
ncbi:MAG: DUF2764 family protein [Paludibacteraceae bacterium]|nr:DUF2764 family protein [Paludibacteraceae bacterium]